MLVMGMQGCFGLFFEPLTEELGWSRTEISGAFSLAQIVYGVSAIFIGLINDRFGPRAAVSLCGIAAGLGCMLMSQVNSIWHIYLFYGVLFGIGNAIFVPLLSSITKWFVKRRSMMSGIAFAGAGFGMLMMPMVVNWFIRSYDWRLSFSIAGITMLTVSVLAAIFLRGSPEQMGQEAYGYSQTNKSINKRKLSGHSIKTAFLTASFWMICAIMVCYGFSFVSLQVHVVPYATDSGISSTMAASILTIMGAATIFGQIGLGATGDKIGYIKVFLLGLIMIVLSIFSIMFSNQYFAFIVFSVLLGLAFGDCGAMYSPIAAQLFGLASHGLFLGILSFCFTIGGAIGSLAFGYIFDTTLSYNIALWLSAALSIIAVVLMFWLNIRGIKESGKIPQGIR
ncbi:MAG: MFS transporter [Dehalococcoidales bacterium]|nr:MFS transporter [Dehalococcoidales bacterium]